MLGLGRYILARSLPSKNLWLKTGAQVVRAGIGPRHEESMNADTGTGGAERTDTGHCEETTKVPGMATETELDGILDRCLRGLASY